MVQEISHLVECQYFLQQRPVLYTCPPFQLLRQLYINKWQILPFPCPHFIFGNVDFLQNDIQLLIVSQC